MSTGKGKNSHLKCCYSCFKDEAIREYIKKISKETGKCNYCNQYNKTLVIPGELSEFLLKGIEREYIDTCNTCYDAKQPSPYPQAYTLEEILSWNEDILSDSCKKHYELINDLISGMDPTEYERIEGASYVSSCEFLNINEYDEGKIWKWDAFKDCIKHCNRYFGNNEVDKIACLTEIKDLLKESVTVILTNMEFWRGRVKSIDIELYKRKQIEKELGPPPLPLTSNSRMNPSGIAYFYVCNDVETCIAEIKPDVGDEVWMACFCPRNKLKILDLTKTPQVIIPSIFDQSYNPKMRLATDFLDEFQKDIAKPISSTDSHIEYVPTQAFAEFIRDEGFHGIKYRSSQNNSGCNYVLFFNNEQNTPSDDGDLSYKDSSRWYLESFWLKDFQLINILSLSYQNEIASNLNFRKNRLSRKKNTTKYGSHDSDNPPF